MDIRGIEGLSPEQIQDELDRGARFVLYTWTVSVIIMTFRRPTDIFFVRGGESRFAKGLPYTLLTLLVGWWGIPWGPIYSLMSLGSNCSGGKDVTDEVLASLGTSDAQQRRLGQREAREALRARDAG